MNMAFYLFIKTDNKTLSKFLYKEIFKVKTA